MEIPHRLIPVEELPHLKMGQEHLRTHEAYQGAYRAWEEAHTLRRKFNEKHEELNREINKMVVEKAKDYLPSFSEYESAQSPSIQSYFSSERFMNAIFIEIQGLIRDPKLKPDHPREFRVQEESDKDGHWWSLVWWDNGVLRSRRSSFTNQDEDNVRRILTEILSDPKIAQTVRELSKLYDQEINVEVNRFKEELKPIVDKLKDKQFNRILQGNCDICR